MDGLLFFFLDIHGNKVVKHLLDFGDKYVQNIIIQSNNFGKIVYTHG